MIGICGADCSECELFKSKNCQGCKNTNGCPFGKKCWIAKYIEVGGSESFEKQKELLLKEINSLGIEGMPIIKELHPFFACPGLYLKQIVSGNFSPSVFFKNSI